MPKWKAAPKEQASGVKAAPKAKASGPGTADPGYLDPQQEKTLEEWQEFVNTCGLKLTTLEAEVSELGECIAAIHREDLDTLDGWLNHLENAILSLLIMSHRGNIEREPMISLILLQTFVILRKCSIEGLPT